MKPARVTRRPRAEDDIRSAVTWLTGNAPMSAVLSFIGAVEAAVDTLAQHPFIGADRAHRLGVPRLRALLLRGHPYAVLYLADAGEVDVLRVLHTSRDIDLNLLSDEK